MKEMKNEFSDNFLFLNQKTYLSLIIVSILQQIIYAE